MNKIEEMQENLMQSNEPGHHVFKELTVVVPTIGRPILRRCLGSIMKGKVLPAYIIVVDQGENPETVEWIESIKMMGQEIFHIHSNGRSPASARNEGIEKVSTQFAAAIDDDCVAEHDWLEQMENLLHKNPKTIITGRLEPAGDGIPPTIVTSDVPYLYTHPSIRVLSPLASANMGFAVDIAMHIGQFDGNVSPAEDNDWAYRALCAGISILYAPEMIVYHVHWRDRLQMAATFREYSWSQGAFYGKHLRHGDWSMILRILLSLFRGFRALLYGLTWNDYERRVNGYAHITRLLPGVLAGLKGFQS